MCDPVTATAMALSAGGSFLEQREANTNAKRMANARDQTYQANVIKQNRYADESGQAFADNTQSQGRESFDERINQETDRINKAFADTKIQPDYNTGLVSNAPKNIITARQDASDEASAETGRNADAFAKLGGYKGASFNQALDRNKFARLFGNIQSQAGGESRLLPLEIQAASNNANKGSSAFPQLLKAGGAGLGMFGAGGGSFTNTVESPLAAGAMGPGTPVTSYGLFQNGKPLQAFGSQMVF